jgi:hypothetical protein
MKRHKVLIIITVIQLMLVALFAAPVSAADHGIISGSVYNDANGNAQPEIGEPNIPNATIYLQRQGEEPRSFVADDNGFFVVTDLPYGEYRVWAVDASNRLSTAQIIGLDEVTGASSVELPIVYDMSNDVEYQSVSNIFLPFINR